MTYTYDPDRFDAEILLDRAGVTAPYTTPALCRLFGITRQTVQNRIRDGWIPKPAVPGTTQQPHEWTFEQVIDMLIVGTEPKPRPLKPIPHGTRGGYSAHYRRGIPPCDLCLEAERVRSFRVRQARKAAVA